jgi:hypothetical protein
MAVHSTPGAQMQIQFFMASGDLQLLAWSQLPQRPT